METKQWMKLVITRSQAHELAKAPTFAINATTPIHLSSDISPIRDFGEGGRILLKEISSADWIVHWKYLELIGIFINALCHVIQPFILFNLVYFGEIWIISKIFIFNILINNFSVNDFFWEIINYEAEWTSET